MLKKILNLSLFNCCLFLFGCSQSEQETLKSVTWSDLKTTLEVEIENESQKSFRLEAGSYNSKVIVSAKKEKELFQVVVSDRKLTANEVYWIARAYNGVIAKSNVKANYRLYQVGGKKDLQPKIEIFLGEYMYIAPSTYFRLDNEATLRDGVNEVTWEGLQPLDFDGYKERIEAARKKGMSKIQGTINLTKIK